MGNYKKHKSIGPGGIKCSCCTPIGGSMKKVKTFLNRLFRRTAKQTLKKEIE